MPSELSTATTSLAPDPYARWAQLREEAAVQWSDERSAWLVLSHAAAHIAYRSDALSTEIYEGFRPSPAPMPSSFERSPEVNARLRALVGKTMPSTDWMREAIVDAGAPIIDAAVAQERLDFARDLAEPLAATWLSTVFGIDLGRQRELGGLLKIIDKDPEPVRRLAASDILREELLREVAQRRAHPGTDVFTWMSMAWETAGADDVDLASFIAPAIFSVAEGRGAQLLTATMFALLQEPDAYAAVARGGFEVALDAAREAARWEPINPVSPRVVMRQLDLAGATLRPNDIVFIILPAVCRDPAQHPEPDQFRLGRSESSLVFGSGLHACLGRSFALTTTAAMLHDLLSTRQLTIASTGEPEFLIDIGRACRSLPVMITRAKGRRHQPDTTEPAALG